MKVSILIHNINRADILERCLSSVAAQTYRPLEVVILDAGSTDSSPEVIARAAVVMRLVGMEVRIVSCPLMGVSASRNLAALQASGNLWCFLDNDATLVSPQSIEPLIALFQANPRLGVVAFRILQGDFNEIDPLAWVFRRSPEKWADKMFRTFIFAGAGCCIRADIFQALNGFWEQLRYSREEEDLSLALVDHGWEIIYTPAITIRHYADQRGRVSMAQRRFIELRNGILVMWRRLPAIFALLGIGGRILTISLKMMRDGYGLVRLWQAIPEAIQEWRRHCLKREPIRLQSALKYVALHFHY